MGDTLGMGGLRSSSREAAINDYEDRMVKGTTPANAPRPPVLQDDKLHPGLRESSAYKPSQTERATHQYGAPIGVPLLHGAGK